MHFQKASASVYHWPFTALPETEYLLRIAILEDDPDQMALLKRWLADAGHDVHGYSLGRDVLNAFSRCFVHVDRLTSTISCIYASGELHGRDSVAFERDQNTMVWFTVGTLRELALAGC